MKILLINNEFSPIGGGGSIVTRYAAKELIRLNHEVHIVTSSYKDLPRYEIKDGYHIHRVPAIRKRADYCSVWELAIFSLSALIFCLRFVRQFKPAIIQAYFAVPAGGIAYVINKIYKIPYCIFLGGSDVPYANKVRYRLLYPFLSPMIKIFWRNATAVTACSQGLIADAKAYDPQQEFILIPNGVDLEHFRPSTMEHEGPIRILMVGRLIKRKGFQYLISAIPPLLNKTRKKFVVELLGSGPDETSLRDLIKELKVESLVRFLGPSSYGELPRHYQRADLFVLPSTSEGMPLVLLEAIASGLPAVVSKVEGNDELVKHEKNGYVLTLSQILEPKIFSEYLFRLIDNVNLRKDMGIESREIAKSFGWKEIINKYIKIYKEV